MPAPTTDRSLTAHQLAKLLLDGPDLPVRFQYNFGDYWRTDVAAGVRDADRGQVTWSEYHRMDKVVTEDDVRELEGARDVIIVS